MDKLFLDAKLKFDLDVAGNDQGTITKISTKMDLLKKTMDEIESLIDRGVSEDAGEVYSHWSSSQPTFKEYGDES
jgi:hypothetical protein